MRLAAAPSLVAGAWIAVATLAFGLLSLALGMDANWDMRNYHYYLPYAFLNHRHGYDILAAQSPTFFNPLLDVPFFLAAEALPAWAVGSGLGALQAVPFTLLLCLARHTLAIDNPVHRTHAAALIALTGTTGAMALGTLGTVFYDNLLPIGFLVSLLMVVRQGARIVKGPIGRGVGLAFMAGWPVGVTAILKLPHAVTAVGVCLAVLAVPGPLSRRLTATAFLTLGVLAGMGLAGGWWHWHLWQAYGNPVFPAFNDIFQSPWAAPDPYRGNVFLPSGMWERLTFALVYPFAPEETAEVPFRDLRITTLFLLLPVAVLARLTAPLAGRERRGASLVHPGPARCILTAAVFTYLAWIAVFAIYRYAVGLEMLAPLALVAAIGWLPLPRRGGIAVLVLGMMVASTCPADWGRVPWSDRYLTVQGLPVLPAHSMVLMTGRGALSFLIPAFPPHVRFVRIDGWFATPWEDNGFTRLVHREILVHQGALFMLFVAHDRSRAHQTAGAYGLQMDETGCVFPTSFEAYHLCPLQR